jgi:hypothetical protein
VAGVPDGFAVAGVPDGFAVAGVPDGFAVAGVPDGFAVAGVPPAGVQRCPQLAQRTVAVAASAAGGTSYAMPQWGQVIFISKHHAHVRRAEKRDGARRQRQFHAMTSLDFQPMGRSYARPFLICPDATRDLSPRGTCGDANSARQRLRNVPYTATIWINHFPRARRTGTFPRNATFKVPFGPPLNGGLHHRCGIDRYKHYAGNVNHFLICWPKSHATARIGMYQK